MDCICHLGYYVFRVRAWLQSVLVFFGSAFLSLVELIRHPRQRSIQALVSACYEHGVSNMKSVLTIAVVISFSVTFFIFMQLSLIGAENLLVKLYSSILFVWIAPFAINFTLLFRKASTIKIEFHPEDYPHNSDYVVSQCIAVILCACLFYSWYLMSSILVSMLLSMLYGFGYDQYLHALYVHFIFKGFYMGLIKTGGSAVVLSFVLLFYQYQHHYPFQYKKHTIAVNAILYGGVIIACFQVGLQNIQLRW